MKKAPLMPLGSLLGFYFWLSKIQTGKKKKKEKKSTREKQISKVSKLIKGKLHSYKKTEKRKTRFYMLE